MCCARLLDNTFQLLLLMKINMICKHIFRNNNPRLFKGNKVKEKKDKFTGQ